MPATPLASHPIADSDAVAEIAVATASRCGYVATSPSLRGRGRPKGEKMDRYEKYPYVVVPSQGMYGDGRVNVISRHATFEAAAKAAEKWTRELKEAWRQYGGHSGFYYVAKYDGDRFWADQPPAHIDGPVTD